MEKEMVGVLDGAQQTEGQLCPPSFQEAAASPWTHPLWTLTHINPTTAFSLGLETAPSEKLKHLL